jgi:tetratricopeptide (TPR) repeat protein
MHALQGLGLLALRQGDLPRALPLLERAVSLCQEANLPTNFPWMAEPLGAAYTLAGRIAEAVPLLTQVLERSMETEMVVTQARCRLSLGEAQMLVGHLEEAHTLTEGALAFARAHQERGNEAYALRLLGEIAARCDPLESDQAVRYYQQALALTDELGMRPLMAHCHLGLGILYSRIGRREQARAALSTALTLLRSMGMTFWLPQAEAALATVY